MTTNTYIMKSLDGVYALTIKDLKSYNYSLHQLFKAEDDYRYLNDSLHLFVTNSNLLIAFAQNEGSPRNLKTTVGLMKLDITEV